VATDETQKDLLRKTYDMATQQLREAHPEEFIDLRKTAAKELGVEWEPRLTAQQRAEQDFDALIQAYPHLLERADRT
jgi:hypothetical protein